MVGKLKLIKSKLSEVYKLAPRLREDDKKEVIATGSTPLNSLKEGVKTSTECISVYDSTNTIIGMYGYTLLQNNVAIVWFLGSDDIEKYPLTFIKEGKNFINNLTKKGLTVTNYVYSKNPTHIKFLQCIGCTIEFSKPIYVNNEIFYRFFKLGE